MADSVNEKKAYRAPSLKRYGDVAKLTASGAGGSPENGSPANSKKI